MDEDSQNYDVLGGIGNEDDTPNPIGVKPITRKKLSEIVVLKLQNAGLSIQLLQMQAGQVMSERDKVLNEELQRLDCNTLEWRLDQNTWEFIKKEA